MKHKCGLQIWLIHNIQWSQLDWQNYPKPTKTSALHFYSSILSKSLFWFDDSFLCVHNWICACTHEKRSTTQNKLFIKKYILTPTIIKGITRPPKKQQDFGRNVRPSFAGNIIVGKLPDTQKPTKSFIPPQQPKSNFVPNLAAAGLRTTPR